MSELAVLTRACPSTLSIHHRLHALSAGPCRRVLSGCRHSRPWFKTRSFLKGSTLRLVSRRVKTATGFDTAVFEKAASNWRGGLYFAPNHGRKCTPQKCAHGLVLQNFSKDSLQRQTLVCCFQLHCLKELHPCKTSTRPINHIVSRQV